MLEITNCVTTGTISAKRAFAPLHPLKTPQRSSFKGGGGVCNPLMIPGVSGTPPPSGMG